MFTLFAHTGHSHGMEAMTGMSDINHCMSVIIGAGIIISILIAMIIYLLVSWQPKNRTSVNKATKTKKRK